MSSVFTNIYPDKSRYEEEIELNDNPSQLDEREYKSSPRNQVIAAIICNLGMFCLGAVFGWSSPVVIQLMDTGFLTESDATWSGALVPLGGLASLPTFGIIAHKFGRKAGGYFCAIMYILGLILKAWGPTSTWLLFGRFLCGLGAGSATTLPTLYVGETVETKYRGILGSLLLCLEGFGLLYSYGIGMHLSYRNELSAIILPLPAMFLILYTFLPETPMQELRMGNELGALKSLAWLRRLPLNSKQLHNELELAAKQLGLSLPLPSPPPNQPFYKRIFCSNTSIHINENRKKKTLKESLKLLFGTKAGLNALHIVFALVTAQAFTGLWAVLTYTNNIFQDAGTILKPDIASLICGFLFLAGSIFACFFMDKFGRRVLQITSTLTIFICYVVLGICLQLIKNGNKSTILKVLPLIALPVAVFAYNVGVAVIPFIIITEIFDLSIKDLATTISMAYVWIAVIILMAVYPSIVDSIGLVQSFYIFAIFALFSSIHSYFFLIETKGKPLDKILKELSGSSENNNENR